MQDVCCPQWIVKMKSNTFWCVHLSNVTKTFLKLNCSKLAIEIRSMFNQSKHEFRSGTVESQKSLKQTSGIKIPGLSYIFADCSQIVSDSWDDTLRGEEVHNKYTNKPAYLPSLSDLCLFFWFRLKLDRSHVLLFMATEKCLISLWFKQGLKDFMSKRNHHLGKKCLYYLTVSAKKKHLNNCNILKLMNSFVKWFKNLKLIVQLFLSLEGGPMFPVAHW